MEVSGITEVQRQEAAKLSDRQWYEQLQTRLSEISMPAPRPAESAAASYSPTNMAHASSYLLYTQSGALSLMLASQGATTTGRGLVADKQPDRLKAVESTVGAHVDERL